MVKEKELKKIKFNQLLIDTQATFMQEAAIGMNSGLRHSNTMHGPRAEALSAGGNEEGNDGQVNQAQPDENTAKEGKGADGAGAASEGRKIPDSSGPANKIDQASAGTRSPEGRAPPQPQAESASSAKREDDAKSRPANPADVLPDEPAPPLSATKGRSTSDQREPPNRSAESKNAAGLSAADPPTAPEDRPQEKAEQSDKKSSARGPINLQDVVVEDLGEYEGPGNSNTRTAVKAGSGARLNGDHAYASFAGNAAIGAGGNDIASTEKLLGLGDLDPTEFLKNLQLDGEHDESAAAALGLGDIQIDELLDCGDDLMDIE